MYIGAPEKKGIGLMTCMMRHENVGFCKLKFIDIENNHLVPSIFS